MDHDLTSRIVPVTLLSVDLHSFHCDPNYADSVIGLAMSMEQQEAHRKIRAAVFLSIKGAWRPLIEIITIMTIQ